MSVCACVSISVRVYLYECTCVCVCVCVCVCMCGEHKPYTAIRRKCQRLLNASLRTNRQYRFTMQQSPNLRVNNRSNGNNTSKLNIINNKITKYLLGLNYECVKKSKKRIAL